MPPSRRGAVPSSLIEFPAQSRASARLDVPGKADIRPEQPAHISLDREVRN